MDWCAVIWKVEEVETLAQAIADVAEQYGS